MLSVRASTSAGVCAAAYLGIVGHVRVKAARVHDIRGAAGRRDERQRGVTRHTAHLGVVKNDMSDGGDVPKSVRTCRSRRVNGGT